MASDLETRLAFLDLRQSDVDALGGLRPLFEDNADTLVEAFYAHLLAFEETRSLLRDRRVRDRLLHAQRAYLMSLCDARLDGQYVADRRRIGEVHYRIGLEPRWYFGAYALYFSLLTPRVRQHHGADAASAERSLDTLHRLLLLDAQLAMEAYLEGREEQLGFLADELAESGRGLARQVDAQRIELKQTTERARAAEQLASVGTMAAGLAHEIGTPMSVIRGHAELLEDAVAEAGAKERVGVIIDQIDRIANIMQGLLNLARPESRGEGPVALAELLDTTVSFVQEKARRYGVSIERDFQDVPTVRGDADKLQQLFLNLILNAVDSMKEGGGRLRLSLRRSDPRHIEARVADDGVGIPEEHLDEVFNPFFTSKPAGEGNGLGLVVAQGIAGDHGGRIEVSSEPGQGAEFRVRLPI